MLIGRLLDDVLGTKARIRVLRVLSRDQEITGRELARRAGISAAAAHAAARGLSSLGLVRVSAKGTGHLYSLNGSHYLLRKAGLGLLLCEEGLYPRRIASELTKGIRSSWIESVALFGSIVRGEARAASDLDVLVLSRDSSKVPGIKEILLERHPAILDRFGVRPSPYVIGAAAFAAGYRKGDPLIRNIVKEGVVISGKPLSEALLDERS